MIRVIFSHVIATAGPHSGTEGALQHLQEALTGSIEMRSLQHLAKLSVLRAVKFHTASVQGLPLPECLKRYNLDPNC